MISIWLFCEMHTPGGGSCGNSWALDVETVAEARRIVARAHPDAPPLYAWVVMRCDAPRCTTQLEHRNGDVHTATQARARAAQNTGWSTTTRGGKVIDLCQLHTPPTHTSRPGPEPDPSGEPVIVGDQVVGYQDELFPDLADTPAPVRRLLL